MARQTPDSLAVQIHQQLLSKSGDALISDNFEVYAECFKLPFSLETYSRTETIHDHTELRSVYERVRARITQHCVTHFVRRSIAAEVMSSAVIHAAHETRMVSGAMFVGETTPAFSKLVKFDNQWRVSDQQYAKSRL